MSVSSRLPAPPVPGARDLALFLDVDGTLLAFADTPDGVYVSDDLRRLLAGLTERLDGALALVSGRSLSSLDALFTPLELPAAGSHGLEIRTAQSMHDFGERLPAEVFSSLQALAEQTPGSLLEQKRFGAALHFRRVPDDGDRLTREVRALHQRIDKPFELIEGDHVLELSSAAGDKGTAIRFLSSRPPWRDRLPVFIGDDTTDEAGFRVVNELGGLAIRVGTRADTQATWQLDTIGDVQAWLQALTNNVVSHKA